VVTPARPITPVGPVNAYETFSLRQRPAPRARRASCEEAGCAWWPAGFELRVDETTDLGQRQAAYLRADTSRPKPVERPAAGLTLFQYPPGTRCHGEHWIETETLYLVRGGDWRGQTSPTRQHTRPEHWVEELGENQQRILDAQARG